MDPIDILKAYYEENSPLFTVLVEHSKCVAEKALETAERVRHLNPDRQFIKEAAMLHDIGIFMTNAPQIGCNGEFPYIFHGYLGGKLLKDRGLSAYARVCESHVGAGITEHAIISHQIGLPPRDMVPVTLEEKIICFADKFYSKKPGRIDKEISLEKIIKTLAGYGDEQVNTFKSWMALFRYPQN